MAKVSREEIIEIVGRIGDDRIAEIIATGAGPAEVTEAFAWLSEDEYLGGELEKPLSGIVERVYEILRADEPEWEDDRSSRP
jgi:hypothetical protein